MGNSVDTRTVRPRSQTQTTDVVGYQVTPVAVSDLATNTTPLENTSRLSHLYSHCRDACGDPSGIRIIAASALIVGLLLATAPAALAPVGVLLSTASTAVTRDSPPTGSRNSEVNNNSEVSSDPEVTSSEISRDAQQQPSIHSTTALISWNGTSQALRCSYGLLFEGNTRSCQDT
jgi:hypothetical protein